MGRKERRRWVRRRSLLIKWKTGDPKVNTTNPIIYLFTTRSSSSSLNSSYFHDPLRRYLIDLLWRSFPPLSTPFTGVSQRSRSDSFSLKPHKSLPFSQKIPVGTRRYFLFILLLYHLTSTNNIQYLTQCKLQKVVGVISNSDNTKLRVDSLLTNVYCDVSDLGYFN